MVPPWLVEARRYIGLQEIAGPVHQPQILSWWRSIRRAGIRDDETPWCAAFVGGCLEAVGVVSTRFESARSYLDWGVSLERPTLGCVVVLARPGGGHVGFAEAVDAAGRLMVLGGNQDDAVTIRSFSPDRVLGYR